MENMNFSERLYGLKGKGHVEAVLRQHGFWERRNDTVRELSQGMKRRLAIARAFILKPTLLVLDEPFVGLDIKWRRSVLESILELKQAGAALVLSTHLVDEGYELADRILFIDKGKTKFLKGRDEISSNEIKEMFDGPPAPVKLAC
jgi:ABC-2 type transport system ATP-binding protein